MIQNKMDCDCEIIHKDTVKNMQQIMLSQKEFDEIGNFFKILGDKTRAKILWLLNEKEMCVCDISYLCNMTKSAISHQLALLRRENLVKSRKEGKEVFYSLKDDHVKFVLEISIKHIEEK